MMEWMRRRPHSWEHVEGLRFDLSSTPTHLFLFNSPVVTLAIYTVLYFGPSWTAIQNLVQARGCGLNLRVKLSLSLVLVQVVGPLLIVGWWDGARTPGALLNRSALLTRVGLTVEPFASLRRDRPGTLMGEWWSRTILWLEIGLIRDAVSRWGSWRGVVRGRMDALQAWAEVQGIQAHTTAPYIRWRHTWRCQGRVSICSPASGRITAGRANTLSVGSPGFRGRTWL